MSDLCREIETARRGTGLSFAALGRAVGLSGEQAARIIKGQSPNVSLLQLATFLGAVGLELSARAYPAGPPIRDAAHLALLARLRSRIRSSLVWRAEVPVVNLLLPGAPQDQRAWDATISSSSWTVGVEAETRIGDVQALERRLALKRRDGSVDALILLVNDTTHNRRVLRSADASLRLQFAGSARLTLRQLGLGERPGGDAIVVL